MLWAYFSAIVRTKNLKIKLKAQLASNCEVLGTEALWRMPRRWFFL